MKQYLKSLRQKAARKLDPGIVEREEGAQRSIKNLIHQNRDFSSRCAIAEKGVEKTLSLLNAVMSPSELYGRIRDHGLAPQFSLINPHATRIFAPFHGLVRYESGTHCDFSPPEYTTAAQTVHLAVARVAVDPCMVLPREVIVRSLADNLAEQIMEAVEAEDER